MSLVPLIVIFPLLLFLFDFERSDRRSCIPKIVMAKATEKNVSVEIPHRIIQNRLIADI